MRGRRRPRAGPRPRQHPRKTRPRRQPGQRRPMGQRPPAYRIRVLNGPNAGRQLALTSGEFSVGRVGTQVARITGQDGAWSPDPGRGAGAGAAERPARAIGRPADDPRRPVQGGGRGPGVRAGLGVPRVHRRIPSHVVAALPSGMLLQGFRPIK